MPLARRTHIDILNSKHGIGGRVSRQVQLERVQELVVIKGDLEIRHPIVFEFFDSIQAANYDASLERAIVLGCYAMQLDGVGELLNKVALDLDGQLHHLKVLLELRGLKQRQAALAGSEAEVDIVDTLQLFADEQGWGDGVSNTGASVGTLPRRKVGDVLIEVSDTGRRIVIESKADKSVSLGDPSTIDPLKVRTDFDKKTAYGQALTALVNREADISIVVHFADNAHKSIKEHGIIQFFPEQPGFVVVVDRVTGQWDALLAAYSVARSLCLAWDDGTPRWEAVELAVKRVQRELLRLRDIDSQLETMKSAAATILASIEAIAANREALGASLSELEDVTAALRSKSDDAVAKRRLFLESGAP